MIPARKKNYLSGEKTLTDGRELPQVLNELVGSLGSVGLGLKNKEELRSRHKIHWRRNGCDQGGGGGAPPTFDLILSLQRP